MTQINDCILNTTGGKTLNEGLLAFYRLNGATSDTLSDAEYEFLLARGSTPGHVNDMWREYLNALGITGALPDQLLKYWCIQKSGQPLETLSDWTLIINEQSVASFFGWYDYGRGITAYKNLLNPQVQFLAYRVQELYSESAVLSADVLFIPPDTESNNFSLLFAKADDAGNIVGVRANNGEYQIVERVGGTWTTIATLAGPTTGFWEFKVFSTTVALWVDGVEVLTATTAVSADGYWGIMGHEWHHEVNLMENFKVTEVLLVATPCMTGPNSPYGEASACCNISGYEPWMGQNCTANNSSDAWCVPVDTPMPVWLQWKFDEAVPMVPSDIRISPRKGMVASWYADNNPEEIKVFLIQPGDVFVEVAHFDNLAWTDGSYRDFEINTTEYGIGIRVEVTRTGGSDANGGLGHTCLGYFRAFGVKLDKCPITFESEAVTFNGEVVTYGDC